MPARSIFRLAAHLALTATLCGHALAEPRVRILPETIDGSTLSIFDGDTVVLPGGDRIRLLGIDAPETFDARCERELMLGLRVRQRLAELLQGQAVTIERQFKDRFGRSLATIRLADDRDVGDVLVEEGLAVAYRPGRAASEERLARWCGPG